MKQLIKKHHDEDSRFYHALMALATETAKQEGFNAVGWNALYVLFADKFGWTPAQVRSMNLDEVSLMLDAFFPPKPASIKSGS